MEYSIEWLSSRGLVVAAQVSIIKIELMDILAEVDFLEGGVSLLLLSAATAHCDYIIIFNQFYFHSMITIT